MRTLGNRIAELRRGKNITQDEMAEKLNVTAQAVSKWENDISCPDIMLLPKIAQMLSVTVDELLSDQPKKSVELVPEEKRKSIDDLVLRIYVNSKDGDKVKVNLPMPLVKAGLEMGLKMPEVSGNEALKDVDFAQLIALADKGVVGKLVEVESVDGDTVDIVVE
ncbi:MAG TPA: helix-turn-helix transcriptional regulator [Clostridia bacterium]|jgi:transcriptional regulator with XRE-family HTH domain|nr:helix-turn-helix transcriptional regulator [Clostridiaceae bacterium]HOF26442.1 helix-turn-helix transcriptional regulator [Clostridia bacterium]HOM34097.1 helix-turn-helix transcriptional regulator [Clostridia bacterium]HOR89677.1 helix-turn-helix transcriptional regulator [Clostridia bacterium]HOT70724.1 helix-turn-helix transcriptional regulator [Clostridia bacterium]